MGSFCRKNEAILGDAAQYFNRPYKTTLITVGRVLIWLFNVLRRFVNFLSSTLYFLSSKKRIGLSIWYPKASG